MRQFVKLPTFKVGLCLFFFSVSFCCHAQQDSSKLKKGSYLYHGQPNIEDNSMLIEEAFNQETAIIQHISNFVVDKGDLVYSFTQEIPLPNERNQLSITFLYNRFKAQPLGQTTNGGFGDLLINFRPMLMSKADWALLIPRFTLIAPTGNAKGGFGSGAWGAQFNLAMTKRLNSRITSHWNVGFTQLFKEDYFSPNNNGEPELLKEANHTSYNAGASIIYILSDSFNFMCEYISGLNRGFDETGNSIVTHDATINPGFRVAFNSGKTQIVPGLGVPTNFSDGKHVSTGLFLYLSIEPNYLGN